MLARAPSTQIYLLIQYYMDWQPYSVYIKQFLIWHMTLFRALSCRHETLLATPSIFPFFIYYLTLFVKILWYFFFCQSVRFFKIEHQIGFQQELIRKAAWFSKMTCFISGVGNNHQPPDKMLANFNRIWCVHQLSHFGKHPTIMWFDSKNLKDSESGRPVSQYMGGQRSHNGSEVPTTNLQLIPNPAVGCKKDVACDLCQSRTDVNTPGWADQSWITGQLHETTKDTVNCLVAW